MNGIGPFRHQRVMFLGITRWCLGRSPGDVRREHRLMSGGCPLDLIRTLRVAAFATRVVDGLDPFVGHFRPHVL